MYSGAQTVAGELEALLSIDSPDMGAIRAHLDRLSNEARIAEALALGKSAQRKLFDAAAGFLPIRIGDLVSPAHEPLAEVVHHGRNSLWAFTRFAKVMCRPDAPDATARGELWGYNLTSGLVTTTVGPGFFVAYDHGDAEVLVDYLRLPEGRPPHWPTPLPNDARLSRWVYNGTQDVLRGVSTHVTIGRASRRGRDLPNWFVLCREDPTEKEP